MCLKSPVILTRGRVDAGSRVDPELVVTCNGLPMSNLGGLRRLPEFEVIEGTQIAWDTNCKGICGGGMFFGFRGTPRLTDKLDKSAHEKLKHMTTAAANEIESCAREGPSVAWKDNSLP